MSLARSMQGSEARPRPRLRRNAADIPLAERGAAAVEFALVVPLLLAILCGILDYGIWFENAISARQGVREGARQGVVWPFEATDWPSRMSSIGCDSTTSPMLQLTCLTNKDVAPLAGEVHTRVVLPNGWSKGKQMLVCSFVKSKSITGLTPLPSGGSVKASTWMTIEMDPSTPAKAPAVGKYSDAPTLDWNWCDDQAAP